MGNPQDFDNNTVINLWRIPSTPYLLSRITEEGFRAIVNTMMYLDWQVIIIIIIITICVEKKLCNYFWIDFN